MKKGGIEARMMWFLLTSGVAGVLEEPGADYAGVLERMEAAELLALMEKVRARLKELSVEETLNQGQDSVKLFIDKTYTIRMDAAEGPEIPLRPLVKALFILFLRHPEGILLKQRDQYRQELEEIYAVICPYNTAEDVRERVGRLVNLQDNSFSEKASVLNARLEDLLPKGTADDYKIQGYNGHPRRIPVNPLLVNWL